MELKWTHHPRPPHHHPVLIAPLWNWNRRRDGVLRSWAGSNRTFMELKYLWEYDDILEAESSNRTFMELKLISNRNADTPKQVLIAPLWNWNNLGRPFRVHPHSVLIAPLWNWNTLTGAPSGAAVSSNRTFMELKFEIGVSSLHSHLF